MQARRVVAMVSLAGAVFLAGGIGLFRSIEERLPTGTAVPDGGSLLQPVVSGSLDRVIASLQARLDQLPNDWRSFASLGLAYVQQARVTTDPSYYPKAEGVLRRSLGLEDGDNEVGMVGMAALAAARHDFTGALRWGERAKKIDPYDVNVYGVIGDAQVELGRYRDAFATFQKMVDTRPGLASFARVSYARELQGDVPAAVSAMRSAARFAGTSADRAWARFQLGELEWNSGKVDRAAAEYRAAIQIDPTFVPPHAGLAKVAWARGDLDRAISGYTWVTRRTPLPEYVIALADLHRLVDDRTAAARDEQLVRVEERLFRSNGVNIDLEQALFEADHGAAIASLDAARQEWSRRHGIHVADAMAWALYANGRYAEAAPYARRALALGTRNALFMFHAGMIELRLGRSSLARAYLSKALETNPYFSIAHSAEARRQLARLGGGA